MADIQFTGPQGEMLAGYIAQPAPGQSARGNVIVIQEWFGIIDQLRSICDRLAGAGYRALAPDLYDGYVAKTDADAAKKMNELDFGKAIGSKIRGAQQHFEKVDGKTAVLGFCMGGALTLVSAMRLPGLAAAVCFYGLPQDQAGDPGTITIPLQAHFAQHDDWCTPAKVDALEEKLKKGKVPYELHRYDAKHAFMRDTDEKAYDAAASKTAWARTLEFLRRNVG